MLKVSLPHKLCLLNLKADYDDDHNCLIILPTEEGHQEIVVRMEPCHEPDNLTRSSSSHGPRSEERVHTTAACTSAHTHM